MKKTISTLIFAVAAAFAHTAFADTAKAAPTAVAANSVEAKILADLHRKYPTNTVNSISKAPMGGLYEVAMGQNIAYVDADTNLLMFGHIFDMKTQHDLTQDRIEDLSKIDFKTLPLDKAIKVVKGNGARKFAVFTDPDCPYCHQLETNLQALDNYTMYVFLYPIAELHPNSHAKAESIWCAKDKVAAWHAAMIDRKEIPLASCTNPIDQIANLGKKYGVQGTPTMIHSDGRRSPGALPSEALNAWLDAKQVTAGN